MRITILFLTTVFLAFITHSQRRITLAEKHFRLEHYSDALDLYSSLLMTKKPVKDLRLWVDWNRKAGQSAFETHQLIRTIDAMDQIDGLIERTEGDFVLQIAALSGNSRYLEAEKVAKEALLNFPSTDFFKNFSGLTGRLIEIQNRQWSYLLTPTSFNSGKGEMTSCLLDTNLIYCSRQVRTRTLNPYYQRDHGFYYHLRQQSIRDNSTGYMILKERNGHCGPLTENSKGTLQVLTRNFKPSDKRNPNTPLGLFFLCPMYGKWTEIAAFPHNADSYDSGQACFGANDTVLVFTSNRPGGFGGTDLYYSIYRDGKWQEPVNLGEKVNTSRDECFPYVQGNSLFFSSNGHCGFGGLDVFHTSFEKKDTIVNLGNELNSSSDDFGILGNERMTNGYLTSNRLDNIDRIYSFERKEPKIELIVSTDVDFVKWDTLTYRAFMNNQPFQFSECTQGMTSAKLSLLSDEIATIRCSIEGYDTLQPMEISTLGIRHDTVIHRTLPLTKLTNQVFIIGIDKSTNKRIDSMLISLDDRYIGFLPHVEIGKGTTTSSIYVTSNGFVDVDTVIHWRKGIQPDTIFLAMSPIQKGTVFELENIYYDFNKATLRPESKVTLDRLYRMLAREEVKIELGSHTDSRGSLSYNFKLSEQRAKSCYNYLVERGIDPLKIIPIGFGESMLKMNCEEEVCTEEMHQINRRTEIRFLESSKKY